METYHEILEAAEDLSTPELESWIKVLRPVKGIYVTFQGRRFIDTDVAEALEHAIKIRKMMTGNEVD